MSNLRRFSVIIVVFSRRLLVLVRDFLPTLGSASSNVSEARSARRRCSPRFRAGGAELAKSIHEQLGVGTLEELEIAALEGRLASVRGFGARPVKTVKPLDPVSRARELLEENRINQLAVVENRRLLGIVTDRDLRDAFPSILDVLRQDLREGPRSFSSPEEVSVEMVMSANPLTLHPDARLAEAARYCGASGTARCPSSKTTDSSGFSPAATSLRRSWPGFREGSQAGQRRTLDREQHADGTRRLVPTTVRHGVAIRVLETTATLSSR
jgi:CBS domain-containing protein